MGSIMRIVFTDEAAPSMVGFTTARDLSGFLTIIKSLFT
jgi:hypothetical protein